MTDRGVAESVVEQAALAWLESVGWPVGHVEMARGASVTERSDYAQGVLERRVRDVLVDPALLAEALDDGFVLRHVRLTGYPAPVPALPASILACGRLEVTA